MTGAGLRLPEAADAPRGVALAGDATQMTRVVGDAEADIFNGIHLRTLSGEERYAPADRIGDSLKAGSSSPPASSSSKRHLPIKGRRASLEPVRGLPAGRPEGHSARATVGWLLPGTGWRVLLVGAGRGEQTSRPDLVTRPPSAQRNPHRQGSHVPQFRTSYECVVPDTPSRRA
jgi:hypothetical protein